MKKSTLAEKVLQQMEGRTIRSKRDVYDLIDALTELGVLPPYSKQADLSCECGCKGRCPRGHAWDYEHLPEGAYQVERVY